MALHAGKPTRFLKRFDNRVLPMTGVRILIVEDDRSLADILRYNLHAAGYDVHVEHDGRRG